MDLGIRESARQMDALSYGGGGGGCSGAPAGFSN